MSFFGTKPAPQTEPAGPQETLPETVSRVDSRGGTVIAKGVTITGVFCGEGVVQIGGTMEGEVSVKGHLTVTATGRIKGPVEADVIRVAGQVEGNVTCRDHLQLERTGVIEGDVTTGSFVIENGGRLNGHTTMTGARKTEESAEEAGFEDLKFGRNYHGGEEETE